MEPFKANKTMKNILNNYFQEFHPDNKKETDKVAWVTSVGPAELLHSFGFKVYYPENHGAMLGASKKASEYIPYANSIGYSPDICSYLTSDVGAFLKKETPLTRAYNLPEVPKPDVLVYNTNQCRDVQDWFLFYGKHFNVPVIGISSPKNVDDVDEVLIDDVANQMRKLIPTLEEVSGKKFDMDRFKEVVKSSYDTTMLWKECLFFGTNVPSPLTFFDYNIFMAPAVVLRGRQESIDFYKELNAEIKDRLDKGLCTVPNQKVRLYWDGMPVWGRLRMLSELFLELGASIVVSTYCNSWIFESFGYDFDKPFESMAKAYLELFIVRSEPVKEKIITDWMNEFQTDGIIYHDAKTCPYNTNSRYGMPQRIQENTGKPFLIINGDLNDMRLFSDEQTRTNVEAFVEQILDSK